MEWSAWRKSSRSGGNSNCVELAHESGVIGVRDSKNAAAGAVLRFPAPQLAALMRLAGASTR